MEREEVLVSALRAAGEEVLSHDPSNVVTSVKSTVGDIVTAADLGSERVIAETIKAIYPNDEVISEETTENHGILSEENLQSLTGWIIDPIDGTNNFKHGMAYSGISIGYVEDGIVVLGGVFDPYRELLYMAKKGQGAFCNGEPIGIADKASFDAGTRVCTSNNSDMGGTQKNLTRYAKLGDVWVDVLGSAVLIMVDVASGKLDLYHHNGLKPWDNAAAFLIAQEAGAKITGLNGQPVTWLTSEVIMGNAPLVDRFVELTK